MASPADVRDVIEECLGGSAGRDALWAAVNALAKAAVDLRKRCPAYAALIDAQMAGWIAGNAARLSAGNPPRVRRMPSPEHLMQVFAENYDRALNGGETG